MTIVTWNCNGAFRKKFESIEWLNVDILVIQECEDPLQCNDTNYSNWATNFIWIGNDKNKGLGIFSKKHIDIIKNDWDTNGTKYFISANINNAFNLIAVWNHHADSPNFKYIGQFWKYLQINKHNIQNSIVVGDFNSNKRWDEWDRWWNHSDVVRELDEIGIRSLYHEYYKVPQGEELHPTFFLQRNLAKGYHIDYIFACRNSFPKIHSLEIGDSSFWLNLSDHLPIITVL